MQPIKKANKQVKNRGGRPPKAPEDRKTVVIRLRFTPAQAEGIKQQATDKGFKFTSRYLCRVLSNRNAQTSITPGDLMTVSKLARNSNAIVAHLAAGESYPREWVDQAKMTAKIVNELNQKVNKLLATKGPAK
ncbi:hypothetical protein SAMN04488490_0886 [Marinobacter sp. LV10R510-11A]|uniref:plasmid mobilization protein n=1 Tax=Marinobacter sp. LV10R510-11A TaxID=1415568 RepID=UPI000BC05BA5|nr:hypothetical protein [Marinobacter sp. LV10R510-11A]SOB75318.1 hypothetical protein SAMN04488490_0886 [Marinobacter sp. LV10R510-11A]